MEFIKTVHKVLENFDLKLTDEEVNKYYFKKKASFETQYSFIILPFFKIYPYVLVLVSNDSKQESTGRLFMSNIPVTLDLEEFPSYNFEVLVSYLSDVVVDLFLDLPSHEMLSILYIMAQESAEILKTFKDPRIDAYVEDIDWEISFNDPDYSFYTDLVEIPNLYSAALFASLDEIIGSFHDMVGKMNFIYNELEMIKPEFEDVEMNNIIVNQLKSKVKADIKDFDYTDVYGVTMKRPTITQDDFDYYLYYLVEKAILNKD